MGVIPRYKTFRAAGNGNLQKRFIIGVRQGISKGSWGNGDAARLNLVQEGGDLFLVEPELGPSQDLGILGDDPGVKAESEHAA